MKTACPTCRSDVVSSQWKTAVTFVEVYLCGAVLRWGAVHSAVGPDVLIPFPSRRG